MRLLMNAASARRGGIVTYTRNLARSLRDQRIDATIAAPRQTVMQLAGRGLEVDASDLGPIRRLLWEQIAWRRLVAQHAPDVLFSSANFALLGCQVPQLLLMREGGLFNPGYLHHVFPGLGLKVRLVTELRRTMMLRSIRAADRVMFPSETLRDWIAGWAPEVHDKGVVNRYGIDNDRFAASRERRPPDRTRTRLLYVSVYYPHKDPLTLGRAVDILHGGGNRATARITMTKHEFDLWPAGPAEHDVLAAWEAEGKVTLGSVDHAELPAVYAASDIFVFSSISETFGFPLVEAMASGLPVIAADTLINREICGPAALYFAPRDARSLATRIEELLSRPDLYMWLSSYGRERARRNFSWQRHVDTLIATLNELKGRRHR